jgi:hypothetical protein
MTAKIITSDQFAGMRAIRKLVEVIKTKIMWGLGYLRLSAESFKAARGKPVANLVFTPFREEQFENDLAKFGRLYFQLILLTEAEKPERRTPPERLQPWRIPDPKLSLAEIQEIMNWNFANAIRPPFPGEIEEMIKKFEGLFTYITEPPPEPPTGGGNRVRKVA